MNLSQTMLFSPAAAIVAMPAMAQTATPPNDPMSSEAPTYQSQMQPVPGQPPKSDMESDMDMPNAPQRRAGQQQPDQPQVPQPPVLPEVPQPMTPPENPTMPVPPPQPPQPAQLPPQA